MADQTIYRIMRGLEKWENPNGITVCLLKYIADPDKDPERNGKAWYDKMRAQSTSDTWWNQEMEVMFDARSGARIYETFNRDHCVEPKRPIPHNWTRYFALDCHIRKPHALLWMAVDPEGDYWVYREFWPSKAYKQKINVPPDDNRYPIKQYVETIQWLESKDNPENCGTDERIYRRIIDYAARAFGQGTSDDPEKQPNFQARFQQAGREIGYPMHFVDCKKDNEVAYEMVNSLFVPQEVDIDGKWVKKSRLHILANCEELIHQLESLRFLPQTPNEELTKDPQAKEPDRRNDLADDLKYLVMHKPRYVELSTSTARDTWIPPSDGIGY